MSVSGGSDGPLTDLPDGLIYSYLQPVKNAVSGDVRLGILELEHAMTNCPFSGHG